MDAAVTLVEISHLDRAVLTNLGQLFRYEMSGAYQLAPGDDGTFSDRQTDLFLAQQGARRAWLIKTAEALAGYAITRPMDDGGRGIGSFLVVRAFRRSGVGRTAAALLLAQTPGRWSIAFQDYNPGARRFWEGVATDAVGTAWAARDDEPVDGRPPDTWITFDTTASPC